MGNARRRVQCGIGTHLLRFPLPLDSQRFHAAGEFGADGDVLRTGVLADSAADALVGALVAVLGARVCWGIYVRHLPHKQIEPR